MSVVESAVTISVPDSGVDELARVILQRWNKAVQWRSSEELGSSTVGSVMRQCYEQFEGLSAPEDQDLIKELGVDYHINLSELKCGALTAMLRDLLVTTGELPFVVGPTPIPELSPLAEKEVLESVKKEVFLNGFDGDLASLVKQLKTDVLRREREYAQTAADNMMTLISDQCAEGGFYEALLQFITDLAIYPYAVLHGPIIVKEPVQRWSGGKFVTEYATTFKYVPTSVWDFFWMPDCTTSQDGSGVFVRERMSKQALYECAKLESYHRENVLKVLESVASGKLGMSWTSSNPEQPDDISNRYFGEGETIEVLRHYGSIQGKVLREFGITDVEDLQWYECTVVIAGWYVIQAYVNPNPDNSIRPVYTASYQKTRQRIAGVGICQKLRDIERSYLSALRLLMVNAGFIAGPLGEVDLQRVQRYMDEDSIGQITAGMLYITDPDTSGGGRPAHYFHNIPSQIAPFTQLMQFFMDLADRITQLPAALHGEPVGTGANRTFRGMSMLYGNALKPIQSALLNMDTGVFAPMGTLLYNYNMLYSDDDSIKGDAKVVAQGATGILSKELKKQTAMEVLNLVVSTAGASDVVSRELVDWSIREALKASGIPVDQFKNTSPQPMQAPGVQQPGMGPNMEPPQNQPMIDPAGSGVQQ